MDILMIAFGAMIGWGWVVSTGDWIGTAGVIGAMLGFILGGVMIFFIGMTYAELPPEKKNEISHRGNALREFVRLYKEKHYDDK